MGKLVVEFCVFGKDCGHMDPALRWTLGIFAVLAAVAAFVMLIMS